MTLTAEQQADLAELIDRALPNRTNVVSFASSILGRDFSVEAAAEINDGARLARKAIETFMAEGRLPDAIAVLRRDFHRNSWVQAAITHILDGGRLSDDAALQHLLAGYASFLSSVATFDLLPKLFNTVCAVGYHVPGTRPIKGTGFLIGPDLVMTNFHVVEALLERAADGKWRARPDAEAFCYFDYHVDPEPAVPPDPARCPCVAVKTADRDWLVSAREALPNDGKWPGPADAAGKHDYAVLRLSRKIGLRPARRGGGAVRGWLELPDTIDAHPNGPLRLMVFQHPQSAPQKFDIGTYHSLDQSLTRVRYRVSSAHGSSGGAAVDTTGQLYALHNAEVLNAPPPDRLNQGVRIDTIARDIHDNDPELVAEMRAAQGPALHARHWSMLDDPLDPRPIIGRQNFRDTVTAMTASRSLSDPRTLCVVGPKGSGVRFSVDLLKRTLGSNVPYLDFGEADLGPPPGGGSASVRFLRYIAKELRVPGHDDPIPDPPATEHLSRWHRIDLPRWLAERLQKDEEDKPDKYPAWIIINAVSEGRFLWAADLEDCIAALAGFNDPGQPIVHIPQLRWLFLARSREVLPVPATNPRDEDLTPYPNQPPDIREPGLNYQWESDFAECMRLAWLSVEKEPIPPGFLISLARTYNKTNDVTARKALAEGIRTLVLEAPDRR